MMMLDSYLQKKLAYLTHSLNTFSLNNVSILVEYLISSLYLVFYYKSGFISNLFCVISFYFPFHSFARYTCLLYLVTVTLRLMSVFCRTCFNIDTNKEKITNSVTC